MVEVTTGVKENGFIEIDNTENQKNKTIVTKSTHTLQMNMKNK